MKILAVEDEVFSRKKLQKMMECFGECEAVENGEDALKAAVSENPPDLILLDIMHRYLNSFTRQVTAGNRTNSKNAIQYRFSFISNR